MAGVVPPVDKIPRETFISDDQWLEKLLTPNLSSQRQPQQQRECIIAAVPPMLKETTKASKIYFEPRLVSLGPVHHNKPQLERAESVKLTAAQEFLKISQSRSNGKFNCTPEACLDLLNRIKQEIPQWRKQYEGHKGFNGLYDNDKLARMFLVDGCALLYFILSKLQDKQFEMLGVKRHHVAIAFQDMFLLENQLPLQLLDFLLEHLHHRIDIERFIQMRILVSPNKATDGGHLQPAIPKHSKTSEPKPANLLEFTHLLEFLRKAYLTPVMNRNEDQRQHQTEHKGLELHKTMEKVCNNLRHCLSKIAPEWKQKSPRWLSLRRAVELRSRGIVFKPSESNILVDASLKPHYFWFFKKVLFLPPILLDDSSKSMFLNLIADEMSSNDPNESEVSNYLCFLDLLIDEPEDVKVLREANIIQNMLGSDKEAADLFNEITTDLVISHSVYQEIQTNLEEHCSSSIVIHMAEFFHRNFSSPWAAIAFFAILLGLGLTIVQTYFTVNPRPQQCDGLCEFLMQVLHVPKMKID